jgi:preprotein translocase subunit SecF
MFAGIRKIAKGESNIDFVGRAKLWFVISGVLLVACILGLTLRGFNFGLEFKGGTSFNFPISAGTTVSEIRDALTPFNVGEVQVQTALERGSNTHTAQVRMEHIRDQAKLVDVQKALAKFSGTLDAQGEPDLNVVSVEDVGPNWGRQVSVKALRGLIVFLILVVIYISFRFEPKMAVAALAALFHDLIVTAGVYALVGFPVTPATVVALLTLLGYSLYDTVVVFDRVRENVASMGGRTQYSEIVNRSVNQVIMRSLNTSLTSLLPVGALLFVGAYLLHAQTLEDLALALFVGILIGTYSSIFIAAPMLAIWKEREPKYQQVRTRAAGGRAPTPAVATAGGGSAAMTTARATTEDGEEPSTTTRARPSPRPVPRSSPRGRKRRGGKRRR